MEYNPNKQEKKTIKKAMADLRIYYEIQRDSVKDTYGFQRIGDLFRSSVFNIDGFFDGFGCKKSSNFRGGCGDFLTFHEFLFARIMNSLNLKAQVTFGTGKGGLKEWTCKRFIADFVDEKNKVIYEINGNTHNKEIRQLKDKLREYFFNSKGYSVRVYTNKDVEYITKNWFLHLIRKGELECL